MTARSGQRWHEVDYVVVDVEGNGARPPELVEVAVVPIRAGAIGEPTSWLVKPPSAITWQARKVHGISDHDVADAPELVEVADEVRAALGAHAAGDVVVIGHHVHVDLDVLTRCLPGWQPTIAYDTLRLARWLVELPTYRLGTLVRARHLDQDLPSGMRPHRAAYDALVTARLFVDLATSARPDGLTVADLQEHALAAGFTADSAGLSVPRPPAAPGPTLFDLT
jgi:DNA polymerase III epsilon subunit-like protein